MKTFNSSINTIILGSVLSIQIPENLFSDDFNR